MSATRALFLDRDGVINQRLVGRYVTSPSEFHLEPGVLDMLRAAKLSGDLLVLITNQQGVGKGLMTQQDLDEVHAHMNALLRNHLGFGIDHIYVCTSLAGENDPRRKPSPGMLLEAISDLGIDASSSWFVGDSLSDSAAGRAAGVRTALVGEHPSSAADLVAQDLSGIVAALYGPIITY